MRQGESVYVALERFDAARQRTERFGEPPAVLRAHSTQANAARGPGAMHLHCSLEG